MTQLRLSCFLLIALGIVFGIWGAATKGWGMVGVSTVTVVLGSLLLLLSHR